MGLKTIRSELLSDADSVSALELAANLKERQDPSISKESIVDTVILPIAYHESQLDPQARQKIIKRGVEVDGPGKGLMQFEDASLYTASKRAKMLLEKNNQKVPSYIQKVIDRKITDASKLTTGQQSALAVYDLLQKPKANIALVTSGVESIKMLWENYWWAGKRNKPTRRAKFLDDYKSYLLDYRDNIKN